MAKQYTGTFICIKCGEEWELEAAAVLSCEDCTGELRAISEVVETEGSSNVDGFYP